MTLDVKMPGEDGIAFLTGLMSTDPLPVIMVSAFTRARAKTTLSALEKGAVDFVAKPDGSEDKGIEAFGQELIRKVRASATARMGGHPRPVPTPAPAELPVAPGFIVGIGSSMGGPEALRCLLPRLPANFSAILSCSTCRSTSPRPWPRAWIRSAPST
jgi:two-component system chemotaxis response regulator CheB